MGAAVVCARVYRNALTISETVHSIRTNLIASQQNLKLVHFKELVDQFSAEEGHVVLFERVANQVWLDSHDLIISCWITPKQLHGCLLCLVVDLPQSDSQGSVDFVNVLNLLDSLTNSCMHTKHLVVRPFVVDDRC